MMTPNRLLALFFVMLAVNVLAADSNTLEAARREYEAALPHGNEAARLRYVTKLAGMLHGFVSEFRKTGSRERSDSVAAIQAELKRHPAPADSDSKKLSALAVGKWESPRHEYLRRKDGSYSMLPLDAESPSGQWRIEGNRYIETAAGKPPKASQYTIILLNADYFVYTDGEAVFFESRMSR